MNIPVEVTCVPAPEPGAVESEANRSIADRSPRPSRSGLEICVLLLALIATLALARIAVDFLVPLLFAILLSYTLNPAVTLLERWRVPRATGALFMLALVSSAAVGLCVSLSRDVGNLSEMVPQAAAKLRTIVGGARGPGPKPLANLQRAANELDKAAAEATGAPRATPPQAQPAGAISQRLQNWMVEQTSQAAKIAVQLGTSLLIAFFLLAAGDRFRRKVARVAGPTLARRRVAISVLNEINVQIQRYMATMVFMNVLIGLATWGLLAYVGVPHALLLGLLAGVMHVIPYIGAPLAAAVIGVVALVQFGTVEYAAYLMLGVLGIAAVVGTVLTTWVQSRAARIDSVVLVIGVLFFGWLWKGWGLVLAVPLIAVLKAVADGIDQLRPLADFLGVSSDRTV